MTRRAQATRIGVRALAALLLLPPGAALAHANGAPADTPALSAYLGLGFAHILSGLDHLAFIAGLVVVQRSLRHLVWAITAFSCAHALTLSATALGAIAPEPRWVEPAIALSIAYIGVENLLSRPSGARVRLAMLFGLLHGCGFGGALLELGLPANAGAGWALALFSLGVEAGQLVVVGALFALMRVGAGREAWHGRAVGALSAALVAVGLLWAGQRIAAVPAQDAGPLAARTADAPPARPRSIDPAQADAVDPRVRVLCQAFQSLPRQRRTACTGRAAGVDLSGECERVLSASVSAGALQIRERSVDTCLREMDARYRGCAWIEQTYRAPPAACTRWSEGTLQAGQGCRSSLECTAGLHCSGVGPLDRGVCAPPKAAGEACQRGVDPLAAYVRHDSERVHPECAGRCVGHRCTAAGSARAAPVGRKRLHATSWSPADVLRQASQRTSACTPSAGLAPGACMSY